MPDWITVREAAHILGVHPSAIPKMTRRGDLRKREGRRPILSRADVLALRDTRAAHEAVRAAARAPQPPQPPDNEHEWLTSGQAAEMMGVGPEAVRVRARRGRLPSELHDGRRWFRRDHLELVRRADQIKRGKASLDRPTSPR